MAATQFASPYNAPVTMGQNNINTLEDLYAQNAAADRTFEQQRVARKSGQNPPATGGGLAGAQQSGRYGGGYGGNYAYYFPQGELSAYYSSLYPQGNVSAIPSMQQPTYTYNSPEENRAIYAGLEGSQAIPDNPPVTRASLTEMARAAGSQPQGRSALGQQSMAMRQMRKPSTLRSIRGRRGQPRNASWYRDMAGNIGRNIAGAALQRQGIAYDEAAARARAGAEGVGLADYYGNKPYSIERYY